MAKVPVYKTNGEMMYEYMQNKSLLKDSKKPIKEENTYDRYNERIQSIYEEDRRMLTKFSDFKNSVKEDLLAECMYRVLMPALHSLESPRKYAISKGLVKDFIIDEGVDNLLREYKKGSSLLYEAYRLTTNYSNIVLEKCDKKDPNTFNIDTEVKDDFFEELDNSELATIAPELNERISNALDEFIMDNMETKQQIQDIVSQTKEKVERTKNSKVAESYNEDANYRIKSVKERKSKGILESMIFNVTKSCITNEDMKSIYCNENGKLNMDKIIDETAVLYGFLEMLNMCKMTNVDESYIMNSIKGLL